MATANAVSQKMSERIRSLCDRQEAILAEFRSMKPPKNLKRGGQVTEEALAKIWTDSVAAIEHVTSEIEEAADELEYLWIALELAEKEAEEEA